jgi:hypothetical protein
MGIVTIGTLAGNVATMAGNGGWKEGGVDSPIHYLSKGDWGKAGTKTAQNMTNMGTYTPLLVPLAIWIGGRMLLGRRNLGKKFSIF